MKFFYILVLTPIVFGWGAGRNKVSDKELQAFTEELLKNDVHNAYQYVHINDVGHINIPPEPLLEIDSSIRWIPTISNLLWMNKNNICYARKNVEAKNSLLHSFMVTPVMKYTMQFLADKGLVGGDPNTQKAHLEEIWFTGYNRKGVKKISCGFQHVFLGEFKNGKMSGMHNWIFFDNKEAMKEVEYVENIRKLELGGKGAILKLRYKWANVKKSVGSLFVGTSLELEMALYTVCFLVRPNKECRVKMEGSRFSIRTYSYPPQSKNMIIGSAYPEI